jgi:hypothetical protein
MKKGIALSLFFLSVFVISCFSDKHLHEELLYIDVKKNYPEKEINLTDIADVTYLQLNTENTKFIYKGSIDYVTENTMVVTDCSSNSVLFFSKDGNPKSRFYKRKLTLPQKNIGGQMVFFDDQSILVYDNTKLWQSTLNKHSGDKMGFTEQVNDSSFYLISKADGAVLERINLPRNNIDLSYRDPEGSFFGQVNYARVRKSPDAKYYMRDKKTGEIFCRKFILPDYTGKVFYFNPRLPNYYENGYHFELDLFELKEAYQENRLSGKLKELAASLNEEEDNNIFVLVRFK